MGSIDAVLDAVFEERSWSGRSSERSVYCHVRIASRSLWGIAGMSRKPARGYEGGQVGTQFGWKEQMVGAGCCLWGHNNG